MYIEQYIEGFMQTPVLWILAILLALLFVGLCHQSGDTSTSIYLSLFCIVVASAIFASDYNIEPDSVRYSKVGFELNPVEYLSSIFGMLLGGILSFLFAMYKKLKYWYYSKKNG
ncbi:hypothetical protein MNBD_GAMMA10-1181 [hydrothermal vent metagenome]|uniref:Uncharacterized protein n=1 Tax=hydrothermal vent metagenome TaxID=652676 RepID=A0A3B0Y0H2_9ZZZZ